MPCRTPNYRNFLRKVIVSQPSVPEGRDLAKIDAAMSKEGEQ